MAMSVETSIKVMILMWNLGVVDTLTLFQFLFNADAQYGTIVATQAAGQFKDISPRVLLAPIEGLETS